MRLRNGWTLQLIDTRRGTNLHRWLARDRKRLKNRHDLG
jgi:hypothetical protein